MKTYSELSKLNTFKERFDYLKLNGVVGEETFGIERYLNQKFYTSEEWKRFRRDIIIRDNGCDMGLDDGWHEIPGRIIIHHLNPITSKDIRNGDVKVLLNPENVVCVSETTHNAIHYGVQEALDIFVERSPGDTTPWE